MTTVVISGANRGLGLEFARRYAAEGAQVFAGARDPASAAELRAIEDVSVHPLEVRDDTSVAAFHAAVGDRPVDILIANAGASDRGQRPGTFDFEGWLDLFDINSLGPVRMAEAFLPNLKAGAAKKLVAITSILGSTASHAGDMFAYRASKAALNSAWAGLAAALKGDGIVCLPLHPGWVKTDMGGAGAQIDVATSVQGMMARIAEAGPAQSGKFATYDGRALPW